jgi:ribosomal protein S27AE
MSLHICPKCSNKSFLWGMADEFDIITRWHCYGCGYTALENEQDERICAVCNNKSEALLKDEDSEYWWCGICNSVTSKNNL